MWQLCSLKELLKSFACDFACFCCHTTAIRISVMSNYSSDQLVVLLHHKKFSDLQLLVHDIVNTNNLVETNYPL